MHVELAAAGGDRFEGQLREGGVMGVVRDVADQRRSGARADAAEQLASRRRRVTNDARGSRSGSG